MIGTLGEDRVLGVRGLSVAHLAFVALTALAVIAVLYGNGGHFVLPSDDAYINMGLGRRFFEGTARGEFPSASPNSSS